MPALSLPHWLQFYFLYLRLISRHTPLMNLNFRYRKNPYNKGQFKKIAVYMYYVLCLLLKLCFIYFVHGSKAS